MSDSDALAAALGDAAADLPAELRALPTRDVAARARALQNETKYLRRSVA